MCILDLGYVLHVWEGSEVRPEDKENARVAAQDIAFERAPDIPVKIRYTTNSLFWYALDAVMLDDCTIAELREPNAAEFFQNSMKTILSR